MSPKQNGIHAIPLAEHLEGVEYPATRDDLIRYAQDDAADSQMLDTLEALPDRIYTSPQDVMGAIESES